MEEYPDSLNILVSMHLSLKFSGGGGRGQGPGRNKRFYLNQSTCNVGDLGSIPGLRISPGGGHGNPLQCSCMKNPHGQKSLVSYSPWRQKESDTTEQLKHRHSRVVNRLSSRGQCWLIHGYLRQKTQNVIMKAFFFFPKEFPDRQ